MAEVDEARAVLYREQQAARVRNKRALEAGLAGDPAAAQAVYERWKPTLRGLFPPLVGEDW